MLFYDAGLCNSVVATHEAMGETSSVNSHNNYYVCVFCTYR